MSALEFFSAYLVRYEWLALSAIWLSILWIWWWRRRSIASRSYGSRSLQIRNLFGGLLISVGILSLQAVTTERLDANENLVRVVIFLTDLTVTVFLSFSIARAIEIFWISRIDFIEGAKIPGLPRLLLFGAAIIIGLTVFGVAHGLSINGLYVSTGAMAALIAFAMQRTLGDLFSGISLSVEHPFKVGDWIELDDATRGEVRDLNWRATRLRDWDNTEVIVPNSKLAGLTFRNFHGPERRYSPLYTVKLPAEVDPRFAKSLLLEVALRCERSSKSRLPSVRLVDTGTVPYTYTVWLHFPNYPSMFVGREEFFRELHYALEKVGVQTAPNVQDVRFQAKDSVEAMAPSLRSTLCSLDFAELLEEDEIELLIKRSYLTFIDAGALILDDGETSPSVYVILNGAVETSIIDSQGKTRVMSSLRSGEYFGLASMLTDAPSFQAFKASTDVSLIQIDRKCFKEIASRRTDLLKGFAEIVEGRMSLVQQAKSKIVINRDSGRIGEILKKIEIMLSR